MTAQAVQGSHTQATHHIFSRAYTVRVPTHRLLITRLWFYSLGSHTQATQHIFSRAYIVKVPTYTLFITYLEGLTQSGFPLTHCYHILAGFTQSGFPHRLLITRLWFYSQGSHTQVTQHIFSRAYIVKVPTYTLFITYLAGLTQSGFPHTGCSSHGYGFTVRVPTQATHHIFSRACIVRVPTYTLFITYLAGFTQSGFPLIHCYHIFSRAYTVRVPTHRLHITRLWFYNQGSHTLLMTSYQGLHSQGSHIQAAQGSHTGCSSQGYGFTVRVPTHRPLIKVLSGLTLLWFPYIHCSSHI